MILYCRHHDVILCEKHKGDCFGGDRCNPQPAQGKILEDGFCSVCYGTVKPRTERSTAPK